MTYITNDPILYTWVTHLLDEGKIIEAEKFAEVLHLAGDMRSTSVLCDIYNMNNKHDKSIKIIDALSRKYNFDQQSMFDENGVFDEEDISDRDLVFQILHLKSRTLSMQGKLNEAKKCMELSLKVLPYYHKGTRKIRNVVEYQYASLLSKLGMFDEASDIFKKGIPVLCGNGSYTNTKIVNFNFNQKPLEEKDTDNCSVKINLKGVTANKNAELIYLVSADLLYCNKFASLLSNKLKSLSDKKVHLHIHGISAGSNDSRKNSSEWKKLFTSIKKLNPSVSFTRQSYELCEFNRIQMKSIYSFERFRVLPSILEHFKLPVLVADIDQIPLSDPRENITNDSDVKLLRFPKASINILSLISATVSFFQFNERSMQFADNLKKYFDAALSDKNQLNWHVDQAGLAVINYLNKDTNVSYFDTSVVVTDPKETNYENILASGAKFWSVTNSIETTSEKMRIFAKAAEH